MTQRFVAGIDGGQTSTTAAVALDDGTIVGRGAGPPADLVGEPRGALERQRAALAMALSAAFDEARLAASTPLASLVVGLTGHDDGMPAPFVLAGATVERFVHDTVIAHAGALGGRPGIVVLAGTGSVALGNAAAGAPFVRAGGWGYFFGDAGSALWIARKAIALAMTAEDEGKTSQLGRAALAFFEAPDLRALQHGFAHGELTRPRLAAFASTAMALAETDSPAATEARQLREAAASALAELVAIVAGRLELGRSGDEHRLSYAGGMFENGGFRRAFDRHVRVVVPKAVVEPPAGDPLSGAVLLATQASRTAFPGAGRPA